MVYSQSEILQKETYLVERASNTGREPMPHLKCVAFLRPTPDSIDAMVAELRKPKYGQYDLYFSNVLKASQLEQLADADEQEVVREVQEVFADYQAINPHLFSLGVPTCLDAPTSWSRSSLERCTKGLVSVLLSLKKRPALRYQGGSEACKRLAKEVAYTMQQEAGLFDFRQAHDVPPLLLLLDRRDDPVTPLLNQWTYQAMVHELLEIRTNRVDMSSVPGINKDLKEIVLSSEQDDFYAMNMYLNFGEIGGSIRTLVDEFQTRTKSHENIESIADMKNFVENYPQFRAMSGTVSKHVSLVGELSRLVDVRDLLACSEAEQELACQSNHSEVLGKIRTLMRSQKVAVVDKIRMVLLYALRYERHSSNAVTSLIEQLFQEGVPEDKRALVAAITRYAGAASPCRQSDLFGTKGASGFLNRVTGGLKGVENIYTQHETQLGATLDALARGKLKESSFPFLERAFKERPQDVFVFMVGGATYEEAKAVADFNKANPAMRVTLGGSTVHSFKSFCKEVKATCGRGGAGGRR